MKGAAKTVGLEKRNYRKPVARYSTSVLSCLVVLFLAFGVVRAQEQWPHVVPSKDGTPISYEIYGLGEPSLVFVHGWSCDARYWRAQLSHFSKNHRVVVLDLAGHGHSGLTRMRYTMKAFGEDVQAVTEATNSQKVILIGHSMGGLVSLEAARLLPQRVIGVIGIDTISDVEVLLNKTDRDGGMLLFAVDGKDNQFALFDCLCSKHYRRQPSNGWIVGTNHFCACEDLTLSDADKEPLGTLSRFEQMENLVQTLSASQTPPNLPADLIQILADDAIERRDGQLITVYSNVACPSTGEIWYTFGGYPAASKGNWQNLEWPWKDSYT